MTQPRCDQSHKKNYLGERTPLIKVTEKQPEMKDSTKAPLFPSQRLLLCVMIFFAQFVMQLMRNILSIGIVCMTIDEQSNNNTNNNTNSSSYQTHPKQWNTGSSLWLRSLVHSDESLNEFSSSDSCEGDLSTSEGYGETGEFDWSKELQGVILSAFSYGYLVVMPFGGYFANRFGAKLIVLCGIFGCAVLTLLSPVASMASPYLLVTVEALKGVLIAPFYPATYYIWSRWTVDEERTTLINVSEQGGILAYIVGNVFTGYLCQYVGWESMFYVYGGVSLGYCVLLYFLVCDTPRLNPRISDSEVEYIEKQLQIKGVSSKEVRFSDVPWKEILKDKHIWAVNIGGACWSFGSIIQGRMMPSFLDEVLRLDIVQNGIYSSLPLVCSVIIILSSSVMSDFLIRRGFRVITVRKTMWGLGMISGGVIGCFVGFLGCNQQTEAVLVLCLWFGMNAFAGAGAFLSIIEHAPRYSALVMGYTNFFANIPGVFTPSVITALTPNGTQEEWRVTFFISGAVSLVGALVFIILGEEGVASWAKDEGEGGVARGAKDEEQYKNQTANNTKQ